MNTFIFEKLYNYKQLWMNDLFINYLMNQLTQTSHIHTHTQQLLFMLTILLNTMYIIYKQNCNKEMLL